MVCINSLPNTMQEVKTVRRPRITAVSSPRMMLSETQALRKLTASLSRTQCLIVFINQVCWQAFCLARPLRKRCQIVYYPRPLATNVSTFDFLMVSPEISLLHLGVTDHPVLLQTRSVQRLASCSAPPKSPQAGMHSSITLQVRFRTTFLSFFLT